MSLTSDRAASPSPYGPVFAHPVLRRVLPGYIVSSLGNGMAVVAVSWLAIEIAPVADRGAWVAAAAAAYTLPGAVGAVLLRRFLGHRSPVHLAAWDATLRGCALGAIPVLHLLGALNIALYVALLAASSVLAAWGQAGTYTLLARLLPERDHLAGNAVLAGIGSVSTVVGPPLAGLLIVWGGAVTVLAVDAATFLLLAMTYLIAVPHRGIVQPERDTVSQAAGFSAIRGNRALLGLLVLSFSYFFLFGPVYVALPLLVANDLDGSAGLLAGFYSAFGIGAVLGSVLTGYLSQWRTWPTLLGLIIGFGLFLLPLGLGVPTAVAMFSLAVAGSLWPPYSALSLALFQRLTPSAQLPRTLAANAAIRVLSVPLGTATGGPLVTVLGATATLRFSALAIALLGILTATALGLRHRTRPGSPA